MVIKKINIIIGELKKFSSSILELHPPVLNNNIRNFEKKYNVILPQEYKQLLEIHNGISLMGTEIYGIDSGLYSLEQCYKFEHEDVGNKMPPYLVPFSPDGGGNHYCFDIRIHNEVSCPIVFWQHDYHYTDIDKPEIVNLTLIDWIKEVMIEWTLNSYNYDGSDKD